MNQSPYIFAKVKKLPAKYAFVVMPLIVSVFMSGVISAINILHHNGWSKQFFAIWFSAWGFSWLFAFPTVLVILPIARRILACVVDLSPPTQHK